ncbi:beta-2-microglobulin [Labeo rohita]|uniref:beta-2-microglobulin n=1 Tax=Labeo rohita TaxID=84645 RepID=UPI0021E24FF9|nr:beta-2-microglobulin [Labeo rohita]
MFWGIVLFHFLQVSPHSNAKQGSPDIRVFAKDAPDDQHKQVLTCLVTVIYPRDTEMNIRLNKTVLKDQTSSEIRPNADGSFQLSISVEIDKNHKGLYDCLVFHSSLTEPVSVKWDGEYFDNKTESQSLVIVGVAAAAVVAGLVLLFWFCLKFQKALIHNAVASLTSVPNPDSEQATDSLLNYQSGVTLLTGI